MLCIGNPPLHTHTNTLELGVGTLKEELLGFLRKLIQQVQKTWRDKVGAEQLGLWPKFHGHRAGHCQTVNTAAVTTSIGRETLPMAPLPQQFLLQSCFSIPLAPGQIQVETSGRVIGPSTSCKVDLERSLTCAMRGGFCRRPQFSEKSLKQILGRSRTKTPHGPFPIHDSCFIKRSTTSLSP